MRLRLATFNVENLDDAPGCDPPFDARVAILRPQLQRLKADILCLQEVNARRTGGAAHRELTALHCLLDGTVYADFGLTHSSRAAAACPADKHNLAILSRFPIRASRSILHDYVAPPRHRSVVGDGLADQSNEILWPRPLLVAEIDLDQGQTLHILNLHLRAPIAAWLPGAKVGPFTWRSVPKWAEGYFQSSVQRTGQAFEARLVVDEVFDKDPKALVAVCGDLNARLRETATRILCASEEETGNGLLAERSLVALERSLSQDRAYSVIHHGQPEMLDHILVSRRLLGFYDGVEVHNETLADELVGFADVRHDPSSYHAPVVASFSI